MNTGILPKANQEYLPLFRLGLPVLVTQLGIIFVSFADTMMVGHYGTRELGSAAFVNSVFMIPIVMQIGFAAGMTPLVGALWSRSRYGESGATMRAGLLANLLLSLMLTLVMGCLYFLLGQLGQPDELLPLIRPYYLIILATLLPSAIFNCCQQTSNGATDTATPMWIMLGGNTLNILGNWVLIYGHLGMPELGLTGAGISTLTARWLMCLVMLAVMRYGGRWRSMRRGYRLPGLRNRMRRITRTSVPIMVQSGVECALWSVGTVVCGICGTLQMASYNVVNTISQLGYMIYMSFTTALTIRVAHYTGLGNRQGIRCSVTAGLHIVLALATMASLLFYFMARPLAYAFTADEAVIAAAMPLIFPLLLYQYGDAMQLVFCNALRGMAVTAPLFYISTFAYVIVGIPALLFMALGLGWGNVGAYYSFSIALFTAAALYLRTYRKTVGKIVLHQN